MEVVTYKSVLNFPKYMVGDNGTILSRNRNTKNGIRLDEWHELKLTAYSSGYYVVTLCNGKNRWKVGINRLVLLTFVGPPPKDMIKPEAAHENGVKTDNRLSNLSWKSHLDNNLDKRRHGTLPLGESCKHSILTEENVIEIRNRRIKGESLHSIARDFGVHYTTVGKITTGKHWKHVN